MTTPVGLPAGATYIGDWSDATAYVVGDVVSHNNQHYIARAAGTDHEPPGPGARSNAYWESLRLRAFPRDMMIAQGTPVNAVAASRTITIAVGQPSDGDTVVVNGVTYTFKTALTSPAVANEVLIGAANTDTATNLKKAINDEGTAGTHYGTGTEAHSTVSATVNSNVVTATARTKGTLGNAYTLTKSGANISVGGATFTGGVDGTETNGVLFRTDGTDLFAALTENTTADANWKKVTTGSL